MSSQRHTSKNPAAGPDGLFEREKEVLVCLAMGYSNRDIGELLAISVRTVESHRARLMQTEHPHHRAPDSLRGFERLHFPQPGGDVFSPC
jgi:DNA-binding NarL/FixJ family response regulator